MLAGHFIPSLQHVIEAELTRIDVRLAVDEEPLLDVVVVSPLQPRHLAVNPPEVFRLFGQTRILWPQALHAPSLQDISHKHLIERQRHDVRITVRFFCVKQAHHFISSLTYRFRKPGVRLCLRHHVNLPSAVFVAKK